MKRGQIVGVVVVAVIVLCFLVMVWAPELWLFWQVRTHLFDFFATPQGMVARAAMLFAIGIAQVIVLIWAARRARTKGERGGLLALAVMTLAAWTRMENGTILMLLFGWLALILFGCVVVALAGAMQAFTENNDDER